MEILIHAQTQELINLLNSKLSEYSFNFTKFRFTSEDDSQIKIYSKNDIENNKNINGNFVVYYKNEDLSDGSFFENLLEQDNCKYVFNLENLTKADVFNLVSVCSNIERPRLDRPTNINDEVSRTLLNSVDQLQRVKNIYDKLVPIRTIENKGITFTSKYIAGDSSGGEYFDIIKKTNQTIVLISSSTSYLSSSLLLETFESFRKLENVKEENIEQILNILGKRLEEIASDFSNIALMVITIDHLTMEMNTYYLGGFKFLGDDDQFHNITNVFGDFSGRKMQHFSCVLNRKTKVGILSPGIEKNLEEFNTKKDMVDLSSRFLELETKEFLDESFYIQKKNSDSSFVKYDATIVLLEVKNNVISKV